MPNASAPFKQVSIKRNAGAYGALAGAASFQLLRRVQSTIDLEKDTYQSNETRADFQVADFRHGVRRVRGAIQGELSAGTYADLFASMLKKDFAAVTAISGVGITIAGAGPTYTVTRAAGSYLADGVKIGDVIRLSAGSFNAANLAKNLVITGLTATVATVVALNSSALVAEGPIAASTVTVVGKKSFIPQTGHTDIDFNIEHWFTDVAQSEVFTGVKFEKADVSLPPTGLATVNFSALGQNVITAGARYGTSPTAASTTGALAAVNGVLISGGTASTIITGLTINLSAKYSGEPVVGSNFIPALFAGTVMVSGQFTAYFADAVERDRFINETESSLVAVLSADNTANSAFVSFVMPRIKVGSANKSDGGEAIVQTFSFQALLNTAGGSGTATEATTLSIQDSAA
jgi:hypothetical protein